jgi:hypothetical protein
MQILKDHKFLLHEMLLQIRLTPTHVRVQSIADPILQIFLRFNTRERSDLFGVTAAIFEAFRALLLIE